MMKKRSLILLGFLALAASLVSGSARSQEGQDYQFYKKYGHNNKQWNEAVQKGFAAYDQQDCNTAVPHLQEAIRLQCQDPLVYFKLAVCTELNDSPYTAMQYYQLAQEKLQTLDAIHPYQKEIFENYGRSLFKAEKYKEAEPYLTRAAAVGTPSFGLYYMVGYIYAKKGDAKGAIDYFKRAINQDTSGAPPKLLSEVYFEVAKFYYQKKDYQNAMTLLEKVTQLDPQNQEAKNLKSNTQTAIQQGSIVEMIETLSDKNAPGQDSGQSQPPPPAAAKLPPLDGSTPKDPTPPLGSGGTTPLGGSTPPSGSTPDTLAPLPPAP